MCDFNLLCTGKNTFLVPVSLAALNWVNENIDKDTPCYGRSVVVENIPTLIWYSKKLREAGLDAVRVWS